MATASGSVLLLGDPSAFAAALKTLINNPQFSDVTFLVGKEKQKVFAHRCLLSTRCQVFHAMLSQPDEMQVPLILNHMQPEVFLTVIEYLYTNGVTLSNVTLCIEFIKDTLNVNQACEAFQAAVAYGLLDLQTYCLAFIENHTQEVTQTRGFLELSEQAMQIILQSDCLTIDEVKLIHAVREWAHVGSAVLDRTVHDMARSVVPQLRLALLSPRELTFLEEENKKDQMIPVESFAEAWKTHALWKRRGMQPSLCQRRRGTLPRVHHRHLDPQHK
ncbi:BTB/POZ domain-containing protein 19 isoform X2 [Ahaetulla prasina]|uniref:BTB/POZ domain-containing protein 19 isoform X2 n=1 Tax=Ahaetulla prasina TaxID=499056 RepID=UPI002647A65A|nr:BTB/POZ domain-containing protein 19 isoform X2 [Ahaetulla prasina]